jgi:hypothetical protein
MLAVLRIAEHLYAKWWRGGDMHIQVINYPRTALMSSSLGAWSLAISSLASPSPFPGSPVSPVSRSFPESRGVKMEGSPKWDERKRKRLTINVHVPRC